jgi:hypothetical protein
VQLTYAQTTITGVVTDTKKQPIPGANIKILGDSAGTISDSDGKFQLSTSKKPPFTIEVTSVGYGSKNVEVKTNNQNVSLHLLTKRLCLMKLWFRLQEHQRELKNLL